jgi:tetratricopeptide (TPR) repeat protein
MVAGLLHQAIGSRPQATPPELWASLQTWCREVGSEDPELAAEHLAFFFGLDPTRPERAILTLEQRRNLAVSALNSLLVGLAGKQPLVLSIEDLQWADEASLQWLGSLSAMLPTTRAPLMVIVQRRPERAFDGGPLAPIRLSLSPLEPAEGRLLIASLLQSEPAELLAVEDVLAQVLDKAGGNPLFIRELLLSLEDSGAIARASDGWHVGSAPLDARMPSTVQGVIAARLDRLTSDARHLVQVAAVLGRNIPAGLLERVAAPRSSSLAVLEESGFLLPQPLGGYAFPQALFQEVAYQSLLLSRRKELHEKAGLALQALYSERLDEHAPELAHHFLLAEQVERGLPYLARAAQRAYDFFDLPNAEARIDRAIALRRGLSEFAAPELADLLVLRGRILTSLARFDEALAVLQEALSMASDLLAPRIMEAQGDVYERQGNYHEAMRVFQQGYERLQGSPPADRAPLLAKLGYAKFRTGATDESRAFCLEAISMLEETSRFKDLAFAHSCVGLCYRRLGETAKAIEHTQLALEFREQAGDLVGAATSCSNLANIYSDLGEMGSAEAYYQRSLAAYERVGDAYWIALCLNNLGSHRLTMGKLDEAEAALRRALELQERLDAKFLRGLVGFNLGEVLAARGKGEEGLESMRRALEVFKEIDAKGVFPEVCRNLAGLCVELRRFEDAEAYAVEALESAAEVEEDTTPGVVSRVHSRMAAMRGDRPEAERLVAEAVALLEDKDAPLELGRALAWQSHLLGSVKGAEPRQRAGQIFERIGAGLDLDRLNTVGSGTREP